jgi:hypothetical protein
MPEKSAFSQEPFLVRERVSQKAAPVADPMSDMFGSLFGGKTHRR